MSYIRIVTGYFFVFFFLVLNAGCEGCWTDPCDLLECGPDETCIDGECVPDEIPIEQRCVRDLDCAEVQGRNRCDVATGACVECLSTSHCPNPERQICDPVNLFCVPRPPCESDSDCSDLPGTPRCNTIEGKCVVCLTDAHCSGRQQRCNTSSGTCHFESCTDNNDCQSYPDAPYCHTGSGLCQECTNDTHCMQGEICLDGLCQLAGECITDADCGIAQRCHSAIRSCVQCTGNADCRLGGRCYSYECRESFWCETDSDCGAPLRCSVQTETCHECLESSHCSPGQLCHEGICIGSGVCGPDLYCGPREECRDGICSYFDCPPDEHNPGKLPYRAAPKEPGLISNISLCPNKWHWFVFDASVGDGLSVDLMYEDAGQNPVLLAWAGTGTGAAMAGEPSITETGQRIEVSLLSRPGPLWIGVRGINTHIHADMSVDIVSGGLCEDDKYEPNNSPDLAVEMPDPSAGLSEIEAIACFGNEDWFYITVPEGLRITADAKTLDEAPGNSLILSLHERRQGGSMQIIGGDGTYTASAQASDTERDVYIRISNSALGGRDYRLSVRLRHPRPPNNTCDGAIDLFPGISIDGTTRGADDNASGNCGGEGGPDVVYRISLESPQRVRAVTEGELDTILSIRSSCDDPASEVICSDIPGDVEEIIAYLPEGEWYLWVDNHSGMEGNFRIRLETEDAPPPPDNDSCENAIIPDSPGEGVIITGEIASADNTVNSSCGIEGGDSFYLLILEEAASLYAELEALSGMSISIWDGCGENEIACEKVNSHPAILDLPNLEPGEYYIAVNGGGIQGGAYTLSWGLGTPYPIPVNNSCESPWPLDLTDGHASIDATTRGASDNHETACSLPGSGGPDLVYRLVLDSPSSLHATLEADFDAVLELRGMDCPNPASGLDCSNFTPASIFHPVLEPGIYHLLVDGYRNDRGSFSLSVWIDEPLSYPDNDLCENAEQIEINHGSVTINSHSFLASDTMNPGEECTGSDSPGPDVFFAVDLEAGTTITVTVIPEEGFDPALYILSSCNDSACLAGADDYFTSEPETIVFTAAQSSLHYIAVDSWHPDEAGLFELIITVEEP